ncbi:MAG: response regulator [Desulfobacter sp.]|nr:MAG: response regulator [Desulfobacter sp.]
MSEKQRLRIMLIDQDKHVRESLKVFFDTSSTHCLIFKTAQEGLNALKYQRVDVVVSDYFLPDMDGVQFFRQAALIQPGVTRILMATITTDDLEQEIQEAGIDRFIEKPLTVASLDTVIGELENVNFSNPSRR